MTKKIYSPGETVEDSGLYPVVDQDGNEQGYEVTVVQGEPFPPTPEKGWGFGTPRLAKTLSDQESDQDTGRELASDKHANVDGGLAFVSSNSLPEGRPVLAQSKEVADYGRLPLHRPIFRSDLEIVRMDHRRPILKGNTNFVQSGVLPSNRPIVTQTIPEKNLMGFID